MTNITSVGTDNEILGPRLKTRKKNGVGRPRVDRDRARLLYQGKKTPSQIAVALKCSLRTAHTMRRELEEQGLLSTSDRPRTPDIVEADFDKECFNATGMYFSEWIKTKQVKWKIIFIFCERVWDRIWDRPSLILARDTTNPLADKIALTFLKTFQSNITRIRTRKKKIRRLFTFLGRSDVNDRHLTMTISRDPRTKRQIPQISMPEFPINLEAARKEYTEKHGPVADLWIRTKIVTQTRTGKKKDNRGLWGLSVDSQKPSYLIFSGDRFRGQVFEKRRETWRLTWIPRDVRSGLKELFKEASESDGYYFNFPNRKLNKLQVSWREITKKHVGVELIFHDLRSVSITWLYVMGVPLEIATSLNVGWRDLSTVRDHYLDIRSLMKKSEREAYRANIPEWFKDGLEEYIQ